MLMRHSSLRYYAFTIVRAFGASLLTAQPDQILFRQAYAGAGEN